MHARSGLPLQKDFHGIARRSSNGEIIAAFGFDSFQPHGCALHLCADSPSAITRGLLQAVFQTAFGQWEYKYLACIIQAHNVKSLRIAARLGFRECGVIPGELWFGVLYAQDCRWIQPRRMRCPAAPKSLLHLI